MKYQFLLELVSSTIECLGIQEENRVFKLTLDRNSYRVLMNDLNRFMNANIRCEINELNTIFGSVEIVYLETKLLPYIKLELKS